MKSIVTRLARYKRKTYRYSLGLVDSMFFTNYEWEYVFRRNGYHTAFYHFEKDKIVFIHIPKTGGSSFYKLLAKDKCSRFINLKIHRPVSLNCSPKEFKYVTIIRTPVDRVWSLYHMVLRQPEGSPYQKYASKGLECFVKNCWEARNMACRYYTGFVQDEPTANTVDKAFANLKVFYAVLSFENFSADVNSFLQTHNIQYENILHERKSNYDKPGEEDIQLIKSYNQFDIQLYDALKKSKIL